MKEQAYDDQCLDVEARDGIIRAALRDLGLQAKRLSEGLDVLGRELRPYEVQIIRMAGFPRLQELVEQLNGVYLSGGDITEVLRQIAEFDEVFNPQP